MDKGGLAGLFELPSQVAYIDIDERCWMRPSRIRTGAPIYRCGRWFGGADGEVFEKRVFSGCQGDFIFSAADLPGRQVYLEVFYLDFRALSAVAAADQRADAREELFKREGLDEIVGLRRGRGPPRGLL